MKNPIDSASLLILLLGATAHAQSSATSTGRAGESYERALKEVQKFAFYLASDRDTKLSLRPEPVFRYTNPLRGEVYSNVFIWTDHGRPEVIASVSEWYSPRPYLGLAVTSLSSANLVGTRDEQEIWRPKSAGVVFRAVPGADPPSNTPANRLRQMSALAREFTAKFQRDARIAEGGSLRLLSRPLYRYERTAQDQNDGAIFAFADGTAPHLLLLIEVRQSPDGVRWEYALAPKNSTEYHVWHKEQEVWSLPQLAPPWPNSKNLTNTYTVFPDLTNDGRTAELAADLLNATKALPKSNGGPVN